MVHPARPLSCSSPCTLSVPELQSIPSSSMTVDSIPTIMTHYNNIHNGVLGKQKVLVKFWRLTGTSESDRKKFAKRLCLELLKWKKVSSHPHICPIFGISRDDVGLGPSLVVPCCHNGNVNEYLSRNPGANILELVSKFKVSAIIDFSQAKLLHYSYVELQRVSTIYTPSTHRLYMEKFAGYVLSPSIAFLKYLLNVLFYSQIFLFQRRTSRFSQICV